MSRRTDYNYIEAALTVLQELGGGPISTKTLVAAAHEHELIGDGKWVYHNLARCVRNSDLFDTSVRGRISLAEKPTTPGAMDVPAEPVAPVEEAVEEAPTPETETETQAFPGPTLGTGFGSE